MPSHLTHQVFVEEAIRRASNANTKVAPSGDVDGAALTLGAQGPDTFYHNQRRKPSALEYGSMIHRRGYGRLCAKIFRQAASTENDAVRASAGAYLIGFASHAILDRHTHPFINYWSGWWDRSNSDTERLRGMHPFLERLIDVHVLKRYRFTTPLAYGFYKRVTCGDEPPAWLLAIQEAAMRATYPRAARDGQLRARLTSAYLDTLGYYRFTDKVDTEYLAEARRRELAGEVSSRWLAIVHPPSIPRDLDVMNAQHRRWCHPCSSREVHEESFWELFERGLDEMTEVVHAIWGAWSLATNRDLDTGAVDDAADQVERAVGNFNLSDGRENERPCEKRHSDPLPLPQLLDEIRERIDSGTIGVGRAD